MAIQETVAGGVGKLFGGLTTGAVTFAKLLPYLLFGIVIGVILWFVYEDQVLYKYQVHLKRIAGKGKVAFHDKAMEKRLKNGSRLWHFKKLKIDKAEPPNSVLVPTSKGKLEAYGWLVNDNNIIWARDEFDFEKLDEKITAALTKQSVLERKLAKKEALAESDKLSDEEKNLLVFNENNQPVSTNDRLAIAQAMEESDFGKKDPMKWLNTLLQWAPFIIVTVLVIFGFKYYAGPLTENNAITTKNNIELSKVASDLAQTNKETAQYLYEMKNDLQHIKANTERQPGELVGKPTNKTLGGVGN